MKYSIALFSLAILLTSSSAARAVQLVLREQATLSGALIRLGDVADMSAATSEEIRELAGISLLPAPAPGTERFLTSARVKELLAIRGIDVGLLRIAGAESVRISSSDRLPQAQAQPKHSATSAESMEQLVKQRIRDYLLDRTPQSDWQVELKLTAKLAEKLSRLGTSLEVSTRVKPRSGRLQFFLSSPETIEQVLVNASINQVQSVVVAKHDIDRGQLIGSADVELQERVGNISASTITSLEDIVGKEAIRPIRAELVLQENHVRAPRLVRRGDTVTVHVRTGGLVVRSRALAKQDGALGELIQLETIEEKKRLDAQVSGIGETELRATGGLTADYVSSSRHESALR